MPIQTSLLIARRLPLWCAFALLLGQGVAAQTVVRVNGSANGIGGMRLLAQAFTRAHPDCDVEVMPALGSSGGIRALIAGRIELAVSNRQLTPDELALPPLLSIEYARTPFVIAVHQSLGIKALSLSQLAALFGEGAATYPNGKRARPVLRLSDATDTQRLKALSPEVAKAVEAASKRRGMLIADTDSEAADLVEHTPGAFTESTLALIESDRRPLRALVLDGKVPTVANLLDGSYPYYAPLYLSIRGDAGPNTRLFAAFVQSPEGRALLRANGHAPR